MSKLLHKGAGHPPERRDPDVPLWLEALREASFRRVDTMTLDDLAALAAGEPPPEELEADWDGSAMADGEWVNHYGEQWDRERAYTDSYEPEPYEPEPAPQAPDPEPGPAEAAGAAPAPSAGTSEAPRPAYDGPGDHDRYGTFTRHAPGTLPGHPSDRP